MSSFIEGKFPVDFLSVYLVESTQLKALPQYDSHHVTQME